MKFWVGFFLGLFVFAPDISSAQQALDFSIHQEYVSPRALGMGNAFTAVADDYSAIFYNPAALARRETGQLRMFIRAAIDTEYIDLADEIEKANDAANEQQAMTDLLISHYGDHFYSRVPAIGGVWVRPNWGVAVIPLDLSIDLSVNRSIGPSLNVNGYLDTTVAYAYARKVKWKKKSDFYWGATGKFINRIYGGKIIPAAQLATDSDVFEPTDAAEGLTFDLDIGTLYAPEIRDRGMFKFLKYAKPQFALVVRNAIDMGFPVNLGLISDDPAMKEVEPPKLQRRLDFGSNFDLPNLWVFDPHLAVDVRDMLHDNWTLEKGFHAGFEFYWTMFNWWKGHWSVGVNQMYATYGFGARLAWFNLDLVSWGEEVGTSKDPRESRRYMVEMSLDF